MSERVAKFIALVGTNGTGKTTVQTHFLAMNERNLVLPSSAVDDTFLRIKGAQKIGPVRKWKTDPNTPPGAPPKKISFFHLPGIGAEWKSGIKVVDLNAFTQNKDQKQFFDETICGHHSPSKFVDGGLFLDDTRNYIITKGTLPHNVNGLLIARRQRMVDIFMAFHAFSDINGEIFDKGATMLIFRTTRPPSDNVLEKVALPAELQETARYVNYVAQNHNPYYFEPFDPSNDGPNESIRSGRQYWNEFKAA